MTVTYYKGQTKFWIWTWWVPATFKRAVEANECHWIVPGTLEPRL